MHIVTGHPGEARTSLIARLCAEREDWLGLVCSPLPAETPNLKRMMAGCPCCTGRVVMQVSLARALRQTRARRIFVELVDATHFDSLAKGLAEFPSGTAVRNARPLFVPQDSTLLPGDFDD